MQVIRTLPDRVAVAVSGGVDSLVTLHWLQKRRNVFAVHYIHDSEYAVQEHKFVETFCRAHGIELVCETQDPSSRQGLSQEEYWRRGRYEFFKKFDVPVCTGHTLDDAVEWYLFTAFNGEGRYMEYRHANVIRPFITTRKNVLVEYAAVNSLDWLDDLTNQDPNFAARNRIRHCILPEALKVNPGLYNMVKRRLVEKLEKQTTNQILTHVTYNRNAS